MPRVECHCFWPEQTISVAYSMKQIEYAFCFVRK
nr:MAG TPA: hypothetical protein [Caudoviricetes sp.]